MSFNITKNFVVNTGYVKPRAAVIVGPSDPYFSSVVLLTQNSATKTGTILDSSTNNYSMTIGGTAAQGSVTPFTGSGGSLYTGTIAGTGAGTGYVSTANSSIFNFGTSDFTIEYFIKFNNVNSDQLIFDSRPVSTQGNYPVMYIRSADGKISWDINGSGVGSIVSSTACVSNTWYHVAVSRTSGTIKMYQNGVQVGSASDSISYISSSPVVIGAMSYALGVIPVNGYISNFRVIKGTGLYPSAFTPPTAPLTAGGIAALLLNFENAMFFDAKRLNNFIKGGTATYSSLSPYVSGSGSLDTSGATGGTGYGTGYLMAKDGKNPFGFGTGDFTVEYWYRLNNVGAALDQPIIDCNVTGVASNYFVMYKNSSPNKLFSIIQGGIWISGSATIAANTWYHVAFSRVSGTSRLFINGTLDGSRADTVNYPNGHTAAIGSWNDGSAQMNGYMTDLRVTKGVGRYTASFTLPTSSFLTS